MRRGFRMVAFILVALACAVPSKALSAQSGTGWNKGDHEIGMRWLQNLMDFTERLDGCTYKGLFSNVNAVPDLCNSAYVGATAVLDGRSNDGLLTFLRHSCAKWRNVTFGQENKRDCEEVGKAYWHLQDAIERATLANNSAGERKKDRSAADFVTGYVASVNPLEVSGQMQLLSHLNAELEKSQINPGVAFLAGELDADLSDWILSHCPSELLWGLPSKPYATALPTCAALEPQLLRFELNALRVTALATNR